MSAAPALRLVTWPYHAGLRGVGMGAGPTALAEDDGFRAALAAAGWTVGVDDVSPGDESDTEVARTFALLGRLAERVAAARAQGAFPLVLAGDCISALATTAGAGPRGLGVVWFDAHADFDTTDDTLSGFADIMGLAILTGTGWRAMRETIPGFRALGEGAVVLAGVRDLEPYQRVRLAQSRLRTVPGAIDGDALREDLDGLRGALERVYLHVDLDALDATVARANPWAAPGGPSQAALLAAIDAVYDRFEVAAAAITAYDPTVDERAADAARAVAATIARRARAQRGG